MFTLRDLRPKTGPIPGGITKLWLAKASDVTMIPAPTVDVNGGESIDEDLTVVGDGFKEFEFEPGTCKLSHPTVGEDGSKSQDTLIDFMIAGDDERLDLFNKMLNGRFIAIVYSPSLKGFRVVGDIMAPLLLITASYDSGADQPERNGTTFQLKSRIGSNSLRYKGIIPVVG